MTVRRLGKVRDVLPTAGVAANSGTGNQRVSSSGGESADETTGETNRRIQVRGWVREEGRRVVLVRGPRVLNLKHEAGIESVYPTGSPISARDGSVLDQARQPAGGRQQAVDAPVPEKYRLFLSNALF